MERVVFFSTSLHVEVRTVLEMVERSGFIDLSA